jgi:cobalamin biosynthesis Mg chelatase CobN
MKEVWQKISAEPAVATGAIVASINVVAAFGVWMPTPEQLAAINSALAAIFALFVRATVHHKHGTPVQLRRARSRQARKPASQARKPASQARETEPV